MKFTDIEVRELSKYLKLFDFQEYFKDKTFLITGASGIIGTGMIKWILYENNIHHLNTHIIASSRNPKSLSNISDPTDNIEFIDFGKEKQFCNNKKIDYVIHAASPTSNRVFKSQPVESLLSIISGTENMLDISFQHKAKMLYFSSGEAYGIPNTDSPISEDYVGAVDSLNIRSCYPLGKKISELLCRSYYEEYGVDIKIIRPTVILGLWQPYDSVKVESEILRCIIENKNFFMKTDGTTKKSVIYALDAISASFSILFMGESGQAYNATNPNTYCSVKDRALELIKEFNPSITIDIAGKDNAVSEGYLPKYTLLESIEKIQSLGWKPYTDISDIYKIDIERFTQKQ